MKKSTTTIILIVLIIGLVGSGIAFHFMRNNEEIESTTSTTQDNESTTVSTTIANTTTESSTKAEVPVSTTKKNDINIVGEISVNEVFDKLDQHYGKNYASNCIDYAADKPIFVIVDKNTGNEYARVQVDLSTAIATETILSTNQVKEFSLFG